MKISSNIVAISLLLSLEILIWGVQAFLPYTPYGFARRLWSRIPRSSIELQDSIAAEKDIVDKTLKQNSTSNTVSHIYTPYQVLFPDFFDSEITGYDRILSLGSALDLLREALNNIAEQGIFYKQHIVRIEHQVHRVDPLGWLALQPHGSFYLATSANDSFQQEVACLGSSLVANSTNHIFTVDLPQNARWYGGARFDPESPASQEWQQFGEALWRLPLVELRDTPQSTTLALNLVKEATWQEAAHTALSLLNEVNDKVADPVPPTTLPPVVARHSNYQDMDGQELFEQGVVQALNSIMQKKLSKVVLSRKQTLEFEAPIRGLELLRRWKYGGLEGGHLFWMPCAHTEFFGCTPERLFAVKPDNVESEALAGTRPRGSTQQADEALLQELFQSPKDQQENQITRDYIRQAFRELQDMGMIDWSDESSSGIYVRRLLHLQHICQRYDAKLLNKDEAQNVSHFLLRRLHPTPAVCGLPLDASRLFLKQHESIGFDRGFYAGPVGYVGRDGSDILVAIRSGLVTHRSNTHSSLSIFAGAGIVAGSTVQGEWAETNYKLAVISSLFPQSPLTLESAPTANVAWAAAFVEELIRNGVTHFYVCPGSRSTPLVVAVARAARSNVGVVHVVSVHDERAAGFRAVGYGRALGRPAAVITSSGTAVANLYPAVVEAGMDNVPVLILSADRPYENRASGANQAIDQVKIFSSTYVRWFRDVLPPDDKIPVSAALSDAAHAVSVSRLMRGPVHVNVQFRENLAPEAGAIRNDDRVDAFTEFNGPRFTDVAGYRRWQTTGSQWMKQFSMFAGCLDSNAAAELARLIAASKRGIIVVGNLRESTVDDDGSHAEVLETISNLAQMTGFPVLAGVQGAGLRFSSPAVVPFAEHLLRCSIVRENVNPDLILQIGAPLVSSAIPTLIKEMMRNNQHSSRHVLIQPSVPSDRYDPDFTATHIISCEILSFLKVLKKILSDEVKAGSTITSELAPLVVLGRLLRVEMKDIIRTSLGGIKRQSCLTEPEIIVAIADQIQNITGDYSLFLSNSMPIRDAESFLYPFENLEKGRTRLKVGTNRGASGIDGIIASAIGFAEASKCSTTLVIGDLAALHDLNSLHSLHDSRCTLSRGSSRRHLTTVVINNNGGGIFSFLPIAKYATDASFEEFFGTPTSTLSLVDGAKAFGLHAEAASNYYSFSNAFRKANNAQGHVVVEAQVVDRDSNVDVHHRITRNVNEFVESLLDVKSLKDCVGDRLPVKLYCLRDPDASPSTPSRTMLLLHGWMGTKEDWDEVATMLLSTMPNDWTIISVDLPGHGGAPLRKSTDTQSIRAALGLDRADLNRDEISLGINDMARSILSSVFDDYGVRKIDAVAGYSLGGRVALAMNRLCRSSSIPGKICKMINEETKFILLGSFPGNVCFSETGSDNALENSRLQTDADIAARLVARSNRAILNPSLLSEQNLLWMPFLLRWYGQALWGNLRHNACYTRMLKSRLQHLSRRSRDLALALVRCSPPLCESDDWRYCSPHTTLFVVGGLDRKYLTIAKSWNKKAGIPIREVSGVGHALLLEDPQIISEAIGDFIRNSSSVASAQMNATVLELQEGDVSSKFEVLKPVEPKRTGSRATPTSLTYDSKLQAVVGSLHFDEYAIRLVTPESDSDGVVGVGWRHRKTDESSSLKERRGILIQIVSGNGFAMGVGEVSPLEGLHNETLNDAKRQLEHFKVAIQEADELPSFNAAAVLALDGALHEFLWEQAQIIGIERFSPSVYSGLEMALLSLASQHIGLPLHQSLAMSSTTKRDSFLSALSINGILTRRLKSYHGSESEKILCTSFPSVKVKVGHQPAAEDARSIVQAYEQVKRRRGGGRLRLDANRAWNETQSLEFAASLDGIEINVIDLLEFIEEPLQKGTGSLTDHIDALDCWFRRSGIFYGLDETLAEFATDFDFDFNRISEALSSAFPIDRRGCAALVLKPTLLGLELSYRIAKFARTKLGISAVFSSSFDSGVGLSYTAFLAAAADSVECETMTLSHGIGTFTVLDTDTLTPPFSSYMTENGSLNTHALSRAFFGLSLDDLRAHISKENTLVVEPSQSESFEASAATSTDGEVSVVVSLPLPFSAELAKSRFTDLPQQSRWSPWIASVAYQGKETEWTINVRGIQIRWRATSRILGDPPGIEWESVSGLPNKGQVVFLPQTEGSCLMKVRMTLVAPRLLRPFFKGSSILLEEFLRDKLLKWSLEMFRDVVKADLAQEKGDYEIGDALYSGVEDKASAIQESLQQPE